MSEKTIGDLWRNAGEAGTAILAVRNDSFAALTDNNLEWSPLCVDSAGRISIANIQLVGGASSLGKTEDGVHTSTDIGVFVLSVRSDGLTAAMTSATGDYAAFATGPRGQAYVNSCAGAGTVQGNNASAIVNLTSTQILAAAGAGLRNYIQTITCINESATATRVDILDGATVIWRFWMAAGSTQTAEFPTPLRPTANTAVNAQCSITATSTYVSIAGFADA